MSTVYENLAIAITEQQKGHENEPLFMVGEQLKDMAKGNDNIADIILRDITTEGMGLAEAAAQLQKYADEHHGKAKSFCIHPKVAEDILRKFYCLPNAAPQEPEIQPNHIDLDSFFEEV